MTGISMDTIVEKGKKKKLFLVVSSGTIHSDFLKSFYELSTKSKNKLELILHLCCLLYTSPSPRDLSTSRMPSSA